MSALFHSYLCGRIAAEWLISVKVQTIATPRGDRYILLDNAYVPVEQANRYLKFLDITGRAPNTLYNYAYHLKTYYEFMEQEGHSVLELCSQDDIGPVDILCQFMLYLQYPNTSSKIINPFDAAPARADNTINIIMGTVLSFYQYLAQNKEVTQLDVYKRQLAYPRFKSFLYELMYNRKILQQSIFKKRVDPQRVQYITRVQYTELFHACRNRRDKIILAFLFEAGLRIGECRGIHLADIDQLEDGILKIVPRPNPENNAFVKNHAGGQVVLPPYVVDLVLDYINEDILEYSSDFLFLVLHGTTAGSPLQASTVNSLFSRLSKNLGYTVTPHMLRHGFATEKLEAGWPMEAISAYLRHKNIQSTQIYAHYSDDLKKEMMREFLDNPAIDFGGVARRANLYL